MREQPKDIIPSQMDKEITKEEISSEYLKYFEKMLNGEVTQGGNDGVETRPYAGNRSLELNKEVALFPAEGWIASDKGKYVQFLHPEFPEWEGRVWEQENILNNEIEPTGYFYKNLKKD